MPEQSAGILKRSLATRGLAYRMHLSMSFYTFMLLAFGEIQRILARSQINFPLESVTGDNRRV